MPITPSKVRLGAEYSRQDLGELFENKQITTSREGPFARDDEAYILMFVTLDKKVYDIPYNDYFDDGLFHWDSQRTNTLQTWWVEKILSGEITPMLFVRQFQKLNNKTQKFVYAGRLGNPEHIPHTSKPVSMLFETTDINTTGEVPSPLKSLIAWRPTAEHVPKIDESAAKLTAEKKATQAQKQGYEIDPKIRRAIEIRAMLIATAHYEKLGYVVEDVSGNSPFDLLCTRTGEKDRQVEVKGTRGNGAYVILTSGEVISAQAENTISDLALVAGMFVVKSGKKLKISGGRLRVIKNWCPAESDLSPTQYSYKVPKWGKTGGQI